MKEYKVYFSGFLVVEAESKAEALADVYDELQEQGRYQFSCDEVEEVS